MITTTKASAEVKAADLLGAQPPTPASLWALLGQSIQCSDGQFTVVACASPDPLTLQPVAP